MSMLRKTIRIFYSMRPTEKLITALALIVCLTSGFFAYHSIKARYGHEAPAYGGKLSMGIVGYTRFINPILAVSDADKDVSALVYSGLLKASPDGKLIPDLAESVTISDDGLVYTAKLHPEAKFHDSIRVTTDDIEFTIQKIIDPVIKSPRAGNFAGVTVQRVSDTEIKFILKKPYAPFIENLTIGILPKHIWSQIDSTMFDASTYNLRDFIGSGPYLFDKITTDDGITKSLSLKAFDKYTLKKPYIDAITLEFFKNQDSAIEAFESGSIDNLGGVSTESAKKIKDEYDDKVVVLEASLPRIFAVFFNQNSSPVLLRKEVRQALSASINSSDLISSVLHGFGTPIDSPIPYLPSLSTPQSSSTVSTNTITDADRILSAKKILETNGWALDDSGIYVYKAKSKGGGTANSTSTSDQNLRLAFTISTSNSPELKEMAEYLKTKWREIGVDVTIEVYEASDLTQKIIRPRKYTALLFGQVIGRDMDLYPFWHSSQRNDPGLNIAMYANSKADKAIEVARSTTDLQKLTVAYNDFIQELKKDTPATFLFSPNYIYLEHQHIFGQKLERINDPTERFMDIHNWHLEKKFTWKK